jgi:hypothetical protein
MLYLLISAGITLFGAVRQTKGVICAENCDSLVG